MCWGVLGMGCVGGAVGTKQDMCLANAQTKPPQAWCNERDNTGANEEVGVIERKQCPIPH